MVSTILARLAGKTHDIQRRIFYTKHGIILAVLDFISVNIILFALYYILFNDEKKKDDLLRNETGIIESAVKKGDATAIILTASVLCVDGIIPPLAFHWLSMRAVEKHNKQVKVFAKKYRDVENNLTKSLLRSQIQANDSAINRIAGRPSYINPEADLSGIFFEDYKIELFRLLPKYAMICGPLVLALSYTLFSFGLPRMIEKISDVDDDSLDGRKVDAAIHSFIKKDSTGLYLFSGLVAFFQLFYLVYVFLIPKAKIKVAKSRYQEMDVHEANIRRAKTVANDKGFLAVHSVVSTFVDEFEKNEGSLAEQLKKYIQDKFIGLKRKGASDSADPDTPLRSESPQGKDFEGADPMTPLTPERGQKAPLCSDDSPKTPSKEKLEKKGRIGNYEIIPSENKFEALYKGSEVLSYLLAQNGIWGALYTMLSKKIMFKAQESGVIVVVRQGTADGKDKGMTAQVKQPSRC